MKVWFESLLFICTEPSAPILREFERISTSQIRVTWEPGSQGGPSTDYTVRYCPLRSDTSEKLTQGLLTTNETEVVIQDLDPVLRYSISVAATTVDGVWNYSNEVTVHCK